MDAAIESLKAERERLAAERKRVRKDLKNAQKRRSRLRKKASRLSNNDLFDLIKMRELEGQVGGDREPRRPVAEDDAAPVAAAAAEPSRGRAFT